jgi:hypothetical protein
MERTLDRRPSPIITFASSSPSAALASPFESDSSPPETSCDDAALFPMSLPFEIDLGLGTESSSSSAHTRSGTGSTTGSSGAETEAVKGVYIFSAGEQGDSVFGEASVPARDHVFSGLPLAISCLIGIPLLMRRLLGTPARAIALQERYNNPLASALHVNPYSGKPPGDWLRGVGTVLVVRADRKPLLKKHLEIMCSFHSQVMEVYARGGKMEPHRHISRKAFVNHFEEYVAERRDGSSDPEWEVVPSPYFD